MIKAKCDVCGKEENILYTKWNEIKIPKGWLIRERNWNDRPEYDEHQTVCSNECKEKL